MPSWAGLLLVCQLQSASLDDAAATVAVQRRLEIDRAANAGLEWLASRQSPHGYWQGHVGHKRGDDYLLLRHAAVNDARGEGHLGVSALAGMAFLAGGHLPGRGIHGEVVQRVLDYVLAHVRENGYATDGGTRMYSHAFATLFLAEVHGMLGERATRDALERAVHMIVDCQNEHGAWRYNPFSREADLSVTVCQLQALRAARNIGIEVPISTIDDAVAYVERSRVTHGRDRGLYYYKIYGRGRYEKSREYAINAAAITSLHSAGIHDEERTADALDFLDAEYGEISSYYPHHYYFWYGNYYACQAFYQTGGTRFERYYRRLSGDLLARQRADGSWYNDTGPGDAFSTAVACLLLQLPKQYLPIFQR